MVKEMSSGASLRSQARENAKNVRTSIRQEIKLITTNPEGFVIVQFLKMVDIVQSKKFMDETKFKSILKAYVESGTLPERPKV